jgi:fatty-acyl-CoA synthase
MTEMTPLGTVSRVPPETLDKSEDERYRARAKQGSPVPFVEVRARGENGLVPFDGRTAGELEVRGAWVASSYYDMPESASRWTADGWFKTGDVVAIEPDGTIKITDRTKDLIKSGGEWISSVELENALMGHPSVREAAVIAVPHAKWSERPLAVVVVKAGAKADAAELQAFIGERFPKFWIPEAVEFVDAIPRTSAGKFQKSELRERFKGLWSKM